MFDPSRGVHVIAEAGTNHAGRLDLGRTLVDIAARARAHSVKFQLIYPEGLYLPELPTEHGYAPNEVFERRAAMMLPDEDWERLAEYAGEKGIPFASSVFDERGIAMMDRLDAAYLKFASCDLNNSRLLKTGADTGRPIILSTGMATLGEIERAVSDVLATGNANIAVLHCVSMYPAPLAEMNLGMIATLRSAFGLPVGLSDHTEDSRAAVMAVALGARLFEKHCTYSRQADGFDHAYAMEPEMLQEYVADVQAAARAMEPARTKLRGGEQQLKPRARRGVHAARDIAEGETITQEHLTVVRPEGPLVPNDVELIIGRRASRPVRRFEALSHGAVEEAPAEAAV
ncbi:MAG: N-acetylneuraminate synthase family protein [Planctomycetota bacterium]